jgi:hypothetical protein
MRAKGIERVQAILLPKECHAPASELKRPATSLGELLEHARPRPSHGAKHIELL